MDNNINYIERCDKQCSLFKLNESKAHLYLFNEKEGVIEQKKRIATIFARLRAFFSTSYKENQRDELKTKLISFYMSKEKTSGSTTDINKEEDKTPAQSTGKIKNFFIKATNIGKQILKNFSTKEKTVQEIKIEEKKRTITDVISEHFPEYNTTKNIKDFFDELQAADIFKPNGQMESVFNDDKMFSKEVLLPILTQVIVDDFVIAHAIITPNTNDFKIIKKNNTILLSLASTAFKVLGKNSSLQEALEKININDTEETTLKNIQDFVNLINNTFVKNENSSKWSPLNKFTLQEKITLNEEKIKEKFNRLKSKRAEIIK